MAIWTEWDPLEEIIVGVCPPETYYDNAITDERSIPLLHQILKETREDLDNLSTMLEQLGVVVKRPNLLPFERNINIAGFTSKNPVAPIVPRDQYLVYGNKIIQTYTSMPDRYLESLAYYDIFCDMFKNGMEWVSMPPPVLMDFPENTGWYSDPLTRYSVTLKNKVLWHAATMFKCGDALLTNNYGPGNSLGLFWMGKVLPGVRILDNKYTKQNNFGHIDHGFFMTDDDTVFAQSREWLPPRLAKKKDIIFLEEQTKITDYFPYVDSMKNETGGKLSYDYLNKWMSEWKGYEQQVAFDFNVLVVDSKNVFISNEQPLMQEALDKRGITTHVAPIRHNIFWDGGIHCLTLDTKRKGSKRKIIND